MAELRRIAICDDEIGSCSDLEKMILDFAGRRALQIETEVFYSREAFYREIREQCPFDLVFLDIQLLQLDGVQVGRQIREQLGNDKISIVLPIKDEDDEIRTVRQIEALSQEGNR